MLKWERKMRQELGGSKVREHPRFEEIRRWFVGPYSWRPEEIEAAVLDYVVEDEKSRRYLAHRQQSRIRKLRWKA
jgi:hypothetical protein